MPWDPEFIERLSLGGEPMFALDFRNVANPEHFDFRPERYILHSHSISGGDHIPDVLLSVSGPTQSVQLRDWQQNIGSIRATLSGVEHAYWIARTIPRGLMCRLRVGFAGMPYDTWGDIGTYQYHGLSGSRNQWQIEFGDFFSYMKSRSASASYEDLFPDAGTSKTIASNYATGDTSITFASAGDRSVFTRESSASGLCYCQPTDAPAFYLKHTGESGANLTVTATNVIGTTRAAMKTSDGDTVTALGYINDDLPDILEKLLFRNTTAVGTMPDDSNMGFWWDANTVDRDDWIRHSNRLAVIGGFSADFIAPEPLTNPWAAISDFIAAFGMWMVVRQGRLSWRAVYDIAGDTTKPIYVEDEITDIDIVSVENQQLYHPDAPVQFNAVKFPLTSYGDGEPSTMPLNEQLIHSSGNHVFDEGSATTNRAAASAHLRLRLIKWYTRLPMSLTLNLIGWRWATLVPGDVVRVRSNQIVDLMSATSSLVADYKTISGVNFLVTSVGPDFQNFTTTVELARLPDTANPYA